MDFDYPISNLRQVAHTARYASSCGGAQEEQIRENYRGSNRRRELLRIQASSVDTRSGSSVRVWVKRGDLNGDQESRSLSFLSPTAMSCLTASALEILNPGSPLHHRT